jgi:hypothetical protein
MANVFEKLGDTYFEIDNMLSSKILLARARNYTRIEKEYENKKSNNDAAYFLYMFSRLEDRIKTLSVKLIEEKHSNLTDWKYKRVWDILEKRKDRGIHFLDRVALLTDMNQPDYLLIKGYYEQRNNIAHGKTFTIPIVIPVVINDFKRLHTDLKP